MVDTLVAVHLAILDDFEDGICKILSVGGCAGLVEHHFQFRLRCRQIEHRFDKVFAVFAVKPCGAENKRLDT